MKSSPSTLNPYAESYVPVALRDASSENPDTVASDERGREKLTIADNSKLKDQKADKPQGNTTHSIQESEMKFDDDFEMDLAYLQMSFPDMSDQSLLDVYTVNDGDLDASVEMLSQLESIETPDILPDALDIGDVPEAPSGECSAAKAKNLAGESSSSSGSSHLAIVS